MFQELSQQHWNSLFKFLVSLSNNKTEAEDLMQTSLLKALAAFPKFAKLNLTSSSQLPEAENLYLRNWLLCIGKNTFLDLRASQRRWRLEEFTDVADDMSESSQHNQIGSEEEFYKLALDDNWKPKLALLNPRQRSILFLVAESFSYKEVAQILEIPIGTVMSGLSRALQKLRA